MRLDQLGVGRSERVQHVLKDFIGWSIGGVRDRLADSPNTKLSPQALDTSACLRSQGLDINGIAKVLQAFD